MVAPTELEKRQERALRLVRLALRAIGRSIAEALQIIDNGLAKR